MEFITPLVIRRVSETAGTIAIACFALLSCLVVFASNCFAATTFVVTSNGDNGAGTLRKAVADAAAGDVIQISVVGTISLATELTLLRNVTIIGPGARNLTILRSTDAFHVLAVDSAFVTLSGISIGGPPSVVTGFEVRNGGDATMNDCVISGNTYGGAVVAATGSLTMNRCTISGNIADSKGGGIYSSGMLKLTDCTISGNTATKPFGQQLANGTGGGIFSGGGTAVITNCTISGNTAANGGFPGFEGQGGGIYVSSGNVVLRNTLVAGNTSGIHPDLQGPFLTFGSNLIRVGDGSTGLTNGVNNDQVGTTASPREPLLGSLRDNGGPTDTISIGAASPAVNAANAFLASLRDQRNYTRAGAPDIGAFEAGGLIPHTLANIATRLKVQTGDNVLIGGFIITGIDPKSVLIRGIGPSTNLPGSLANPTLELRDKTGTLIGSNDNWVDAPNKQEIINTTASPTNDLEAAILMSLSPGSYTAIVSGVNNTTGIGLVEAYDLDRTTGSRLGNIATRGLVQTGDNVLIAGFIVTGPDNQKVIVRGIGPSNGVVGNLADPTLELRDNASALLEANDNWQDSPNKQAIIDSTVAPGNLLESAIVRVLPPGNYTAILQGANGSTGIGVVEAYQLD